MLSPSMEAERRPYARGRMFGVLFLGLAVLVAVGFIVGGELAQFVYAGLQTAPFTMLALLAYVGADRLWGKIVALLWLAALVGVVALASWTLGLASTPNLISVQPGQPVQADPTQAIQALAQSGPILLGCILAIIVAALGFVSAVRRGLSRVLPIDPTSFVHTIAVVAVVAITLITLVPLLVLGAPPFLLAVQNGFDLSGANTDNAARLRLTLYVLVWQIPGAILAVGYGVRRSFGATLQRLGLVRPTVRQVFIGIGAAIALVLFANALDWLIAQVWGMFGWPRTDSAAFESLIAFAFTPLGAVVIGITSGLGEELSIRGILQPRLGIVLSNLFFTSLHAWQYNWDGLLSVFLIGFALGLVRKRTNTTTSAITHGLYNFTLIMLTVLQGAP